MTIALAEETVNQIADTVSDSRLRLGIGDNLLDALLGYIVVFIGLTLLMVVVILVGKFFMVKNGADDMKNVTPTPTDKVTETPAALAPGSAGEIKIYDTDPRDAAMIMAIVADKLGKPLNELRFRSIKEVKQDEV